MSEQYEPSYYEIALTGRQVLAGFVILLVCLVAAFFSGVWVGRGGRGDGERAAETVARQGDAEEPRGRELSFFDEKPAPRAGERGEAAGGAGPATPPAGAGAASGPATPDEEATPAPATPPPAETGAGDSPAAAPAPDRKAPTAATGRSAPGAAKAAVPAETHPSGSLATGDVVIQVFSSGEEAKARDVLDLLAKHGFRAFLSPVLDGGRTLYRVRVGPFEHKNEAQEVAERLHRSLNLETWITQ